MRSIKIWGDDPSERQIADIADVIDAGGVAVMPTGSFYALVCDALNPKAIARICELKRINPEKNSLSMICSGISMAAEYALFDDAGYKLLKELTPGAYTVIFKASRKLPRALKGRKEIGVRIPEAQTPRKVAEYLGRPLLAATIEFEEDDYAINPELIAENYDGRADLMVEGEEGGTVGTTVIDMTSGEPLVVREGRL